MRNGTIVIEPFLEKNLKTTSYDVALGAWFWRELAPTPNENKPSPKRETDPRLVWGRAPAAHAAVHNLYDKASTKSVWAGPYDAEPARAVEERLGRKLKNIAGGAKVILLDPGETILAHTEEFIGGRDICVAKMYARSSLGRNFVEVCKDAGWGDVGYFNRWTMEVTNNSRYFSIPLVVGRRIAQMVFYEVAPLAAAKTDYVSEGGKYQLSGDIEKVKSSWRPEMMLPKMHLDWETAETMLDGNNIKP